MESHSTVDEVGDVLKFLEAARNTDKSQRILHRREKVQSRLEVKRAPPQEKTPSPPPPASVVDVQVQKSRHSIFRVLSDGNELVSNVEKASIARSRNNRFEADQTRRKINQSILEDAAASERNFAEINAKWEPVLKQNMAAEDLHAAVLDQNAKCQEVIDGKNKIIDTLMAEIDKTGKVYTDCMRKQEKDVELLIARMDSQYKILRTMLQEERLALEFAVFEEHGDILSSQEEAFGKKVAAAIEEDDKGLEVRLAAREKFREKLMADERSEYHELRKLKEDLDQEVHAMRLQVQDTKSHCLLKEEQLEYACYLLKKREEEYKSARSLNKRKRNKLQATVAELKNKLAADRKAGDAQVGNLKTEISRLGNTVADVASGNGGFSPACAEESKYKACLQLAKDKLSADLQKMKEKEHALFDQCLGNPGGENSLESIFDLKAYMGGRLVTDSVADSASEGLLSLLADSADDVEGFGSGSMNGTSISAEKQRTTYILKSLVARGDFLVGDALGRILAKAAGDGSSQQAQRVELAKLDSILQSLGIRDLPQLERLLDCFETDQSGISAYMDGNHDENSLLSHHEVREAIQRYLTLANDRKKFSRSPLVRQDEDLEDFSVCLYDEDGTFMNASVQTRLNERKILWNRIEEYLEKYLRVLQQRADCCKEMGTASARNQQLLHILKTYLSSDLVSDSDDADSGVGSTIDVRTGQGSLSVQAASFYDA